MPSTIAPMSDSTWPASASRATESNSSQPATAAASIATLIPSAIAIRRVLRTRRWWCPWWACTRSVSLTAHADRRMNEYEAVAALAVAAVVTLVTTPLTARLAVRVGAIDLPRDRDLHDAPVPRLGGLAILAGVLVSAVIFMPFDGETRGILGGALVAGRSEEHTSELQSQSNLVCRLLLEKKK